VNIMANYFSQRGHLPPLLMVIVRTEKPLHRSNTSLINGGYYPVKCFPHQYSPGARLVIVSGVSWPALPGPEPPQSGS
jgi:hypothetical protein